MWHDPMYSLPLDGVTVWVHRYGWQAHPIKAVWSDSSGLFTLVGTSHTLPPDQVPNSRPIDWTLISSWRAL